ncbi:MAG TPA: hypothetical protein DCS05_11835, partial [Nitrospiraceae bacterium]|nr:hypothetical protein [Nitrospiraceae bacterium]
IVLAAAFDDDFVHNMNNHMQPRRLAEDQEIQKKLSVCRSILFVTGICFFGSRLFVEAHPDRA